MEDKDPAYERALSRQRHWEMESLRIAHWSKPFYRDGNRKRIHEINLRPLNCDRCLEDEEQSITFHSQDRKDMSTVSFDLCISCFNVIFDIVTHEERIAGHDPNANPEIVDHEDE